MLVNIKVINYFWIFGHFEKYVFDFLPKKFSYRKNIFLQNFFSISIQKILRNPKIILRTACDHSKDAKNAKSNVEFAISTESGFFYVTLPLSQNTPKIAWKPLKSVEITSLLLEKQRHELDEERDRLKTQHTHQPRGRGGGGGARGSHPLQVS